MRPSHILALLLATAMAASMPGQPAQARELSTDPEEMVEVELSSVGMDPRSGTPLVLLRDVDTGDMVAIVIGVAEARAILLALHDTEVPRPMTHDLMRNLLGAMGARLERILIDDLVDNTYLGMLELQLEGREEPLLVDTRPSDGMALALRTGARILVSPEILERAREREFEQLPDDQIAAAIGITVVEIDDDIREAMQLPEAPGVIVNRAIGEAAEAGLTAGAMILEVNGEPVGSPMEFLERIRGTSRDETVRIRFWHEGNEREIELEPVPPRRAPEEDEPLIRA